jgi:hypothetical protein
MDFTEKRIQLGSRAKRVPHGMMRIERRFPDSGSEFLRIHLLDLGYFHRRTCS